MSDSPHHAVYSVCQTVAKALSKALPVGFRGKLTVVVDSAEIQAHNVLAEFRPPQPKAGMGK